MKKTYALVLAATLLVATARAQTTNRLPNRISVSYSDPLLTTVGLTISGVVPRRLLGVGIDNVQSPGSFNLAYQWVSKSERWSYGLSVGYTTLTYNLVMDDMIMPKSMDIIGIMPTVECYYIKSGIVRLYGSIGLGANFGITKDDVSAGIDFQFNPIALRVGSNRIAGFLSLGVGTRGLVGLGLQIGL